MTNFVLQVIVAYLIGSASGSLILGKLRGVDIRTLGSGNAGTTNAFRSEGKLFAFAVLLIDVMKGVVSVALVPRLILFDALPVIDASTTAMVCGFAVTVGHIFPVFFGFRGGRGAATLLGVFLILAPYAVIWALAAFGLTLVLTGMVGLATLCASAAIVAGVTLSHGADIDSGLTLFAGIMFLLVVMTHRQNIVRMWRRSESRFERAMLVRRYRSRQNESTD